MAEVMEEMMEQITMKVLKRKTHLPISDSFTDIHR